MVLKNKANWSRKEMWFLKKHYNKDKEGVCLSISLYWQVCTLTPVLNRGLFELIKCIDGCLFLSEFLSLCFLPYSRLFLVPRKWLFLLLPTISDYKTSEKTIEKNLSFSQLLSP